MTTDTGESRVMPVSSESEGEWAAVACLGIETQLGVIIAATVERSEDDGWREVASYFEW